jgi:hypothetical protein
MALTIKPQDSSAYNDRGNAKFDLNDRIGACDDYKKAVNLGNQFTTKWFNSEGGTWCRTMR